LFQQHFRGGVECSRDCFEIRLPVSVKSNRDYYIYVLPDVF